ncbi:putative ABC transporter permease [Lacticaseibacillus baoqingensis]|uniref:ABC transporter permease n=1 Tax=Lacticaseibacillus baoqingensis TaxID=2486013 RepID=A0ABW4EAG9_9LACO|nr:putative ABC transporter permease [Lacticaseibacillus baoqingensis]
MAFQQQFTLWVLYFFAYAFIGWLWESGYVSVQKKHWVNSGFLNGPIIPVYGFSMVTVLAAIAPWQNNLLVLYVLSALVITVIEYLTSWLMELLFHARWWDYSKVPLNLNGRVALPISMFWGIGVVVIVKLIHPFVAAGVLFFAAHYGIFAAIALLVMASFDFGFTLANALAFGAATKRIGDTIEAKKAQLHERVTSELSEERAWLAAFQSDANARAKVPRLNAVQRRLLKSFPHLKLRDTHTPAKDIEDLVALLKSKKR